MMNVLGMRRIAALAAVTAVCGACNKTPEPTPIARPAGTSPAAASPAGSGAGGPQAKAGDLVWDVPAAWRSVPNRSPMRRETYHLPPAPGDPDDAEMAVSRAGGSIEANLERWKSQLSDGPAGFPKREEVKVGDLKVTIVEHRGTFTAMNAMPGTADAPPRAGWALLGAIVEVGAAPYFFKVTGPERTVKAARADFDKLIGSIRPR